MSNSFGFEMGINYFFNKNIVTQFALASSKHETIIQYSDFENHRYKIGDVMQIPLNLIFHYHLQLNKFKPFVGAGVNYTFFNVKEEVLIGGVYGGEFDNNFGFVFQGGIDYEINKNWFVNFNIKQIFLSTDMTVYTGWCDTPAKSQLAVPCSDYFIDI